MRSKTTLALAASIIAGFAALSAPAHAACSSSAAAEVYGSYNETTAVARGCAEIGLYSNGHRNRNSVYADGRSRIVSGTTGYRASAHSRVVGHENDLGIDSRSSTVEAHIDGDFNETALRARDGAAIFLTLDGSGNLVRITAR